MDIARYILSAVLLCTTSACYLSTVVTGQEHSPDEALTLGVVVRSVPGVAYSAKGEKVVYVTITERGSNPPVRLLTQEYKYDAANIEWNIEWKSADRVHVELFAFPPGLAPDSGKTAFGRNLASMPGALKIADLDFIRVRGAVSFRVAE